MTLVNVRNFAARWFAIEIAAGQRNY